MAPPIDSSTRTWVDDPGNSGGSGNVERLVMWSRTVPEQQTVENGDLHARGGSRSPSSRRNRTALDNAGSSGAHQVRNTAAAVWDSLCLPTDLSLCN